MNKKQPATIDIAVGCFDYSFGAAARKPPGGVRHILLFLL